MQNGMGLACNTIEVWPLFSADPITTLIKQQY